MRKYVLNPLNKFPSSSNKFVLSFLKKAKSISVMQLLIIVYQKVMNIREMKEVLWSILPAARGLIWNKGKK